MIYDPRPGLGRPGLMLLAGVVGLVVLAVPELRKLRAPKASKRARATPSSDAPWAQRADAPAPRARQAGSIESGQRKQVPPAPPRIRSVVPDGSR